MLPRSVQPEILDTLPHGHPEAVRSRREIRMINRLMGNFGAAKQLLSPRIRQDDRILEVGCGNGDLVRYLRDIPIDGLDVCPRPQDWPDSRQWHCCDFRRFTGYGEYSVIIANLLLHQFTREELQVWAGEVLPQTRLIYANEPLRSRSSLFFLHFALMLGLGKVTRHDARVSVLAGFRENELSDLLNLSPADWNVSIKTCLFGRYTLLAIRK